MKINRKLFFRIHSWIGIKLSILFFIVCFSGTMATLSHEMDWLFIPEMRVVPQENLADRNPVIQKLKSAYPNGQFQYWTTTEEPYLCDIVYMQDSSGQLYYTFVNQYTGEIQGRAKLTFQRFFRDLHYYLFIPFQIGHFTVLIFGFMLFISSVTALLYYKNWYKKLFELRVDKGSLALFRSLHRLVGVWSVPLTLVLSMTGIWYFLERADVGGIGSIANPKRPVVNHLFKEEVSADDYFEFSLDYDRAIKAAQKSIEGLVVRDISPAKRPDQSIYLTGLDGTPLVRNRANRVYIDPNTYNVIMVQKAKDLSMVTYINDIVDPIHFGNWGGLLTKVIWFVFGLGISSLILTGLWVAQKRKVKSASKIKAQKMGGWKYVNWLLLVAVLGYLYYALLERYSVGNEVLLFITIGLAACIGTGWYVFSYQLRKVVEKEIAE